MSTPHNSAEIDQISKTVIMPGDPLRAKYIAKQYLEDAKCFNKLRNILGYSGIYKGKHISVMSSGMGMPSIGIYSHELYNMYDVDTIIRIGSAGSLSPNVKVTDIVCAMGASTDSNYISQFQICGSFSALADYSLLRDADLLSKERNIKLHMGNVLSSDVYYDESNRMNSWKKLGVLAVEMETAALYINAARAGKRAVSLLTISASEYENRELSALETQHSLDEMIELSLAMAVLSRKNHEECQ